MKKNIHIINSDKFFDPFIELLNNNMENQNKNQFFITGDVSKFCTLNGENIFKLNESFKDKMLFWFKLISNSIRADKIIFHGLFNPSIIKIYCFVPIRNNKLYWVIMGGDLYAYKNRKKITWWRHEIFRIILIKRIGNYITHIKGDYKLAKKVYSTNAKFHECFLYPSNIFFKGSPTNRNNEIDGLNILVGNSATPSNSHLKIFNELSYFDINRLKIYCPLSYGDNEYANKIKDIGHQMFGDHFYPITEFLTYKDYIKILRKIDIAILYHDRQQAVGNIINLLGLGKKVYLNKNVTTFEMLKKHDIDIFDFDKLNLNRLEKNSAKKNSKKISILFSEDRLIRQWKEILQ
jgi:dTDP-N-acetylfucosamine:lipid II N-acetylfucosaminyltransferase